MTVLPQLAFADLPLICASVHGDTEDDAAEAAFVRGLLELQGEGLIDPVHEDSGPSFPEDFEDENGRVVYCVHESGESCPDGCATIRVTHV